MFSAGDHVMCGGNGLCLVESMGVPDFGLPGSGREYYFLRRTDDNSRVYVPVDTSMPIRCPMDRKEAEDLLADMKAGKAEIPEKRDRKTIVRLCRDTLLLQTPEAEAFVIKLLHALHPGGKMSVEEETIRKKAESRLRSELMYALSVTEEEADGMLRAALEGRERTS